MIITIDNTGLVDYTQSYVLHMIGWKKHTDSNGFSVVGILTYECTIHLYVNYFSDVFKACSTVQVTTQGSMHTTYDWVEENMGTH